jgi:hypothetical protein
MHQAPKPNPANAPLDPDVVEKLSKMFLILSSPNDGDKLAAINALNRALEKNDVDYHTLVARMAKPWLSTGAKEEFRDAIANASAIGKAEGLREAEAKQFGIGDFRNADGSSDWRAVSLYVQREKHRLLQRHHEFIDDMAARIPFAREPTPKQSAYLHSLFLKLGGRIT